MAHIAPSVTDRRALADLEKRFRPEDRIKQNLEQQWLVNIAFYKGFQYLNFNNAQRQLVYTQPSSLQWRARCQHNLVKPYVRQAVATVGGFRPRFKVRPKTTDPEDLGAANTGDKALAHYWDILRMPSKKWDLLTWLKLTGNAFIRTVWDPAGGEATENVTQQDVDGSQIDVVDRTYEGDIDSSVKSPFSIYCDNYIENTADMWWVIEAEGCPMEWVEQHFPEQAHLVPPGIRETDPAGRRRWIVDMPGPSGSSIGTISDDSRSEWTFRRHLWERPTIDFPRGRLVIECNGVVLRNGDNPMPKSMLPFTWFRDDIIPGTVWGQCDVDNEVAMQRDFNRTMSKQMEYMVLTANPKLLEHETNKLEDSAWRTEIGDRIKWKGMQQPDYLYAPPMPAYIDGMAQQILSSFDRVTNSFAPGRGQAAGRLSGKAYMSLIEQDQANKTPVIERLADGFSEWGHIVLELLQKYAQTDRLIKIVGRGQQYDVSSFRGADLKGNTDVSIDVDSMTPKSKAMALEMIATLAPGQPWLSSQSAEDRTTVARMLGREDDSPLVEDKLVDIREVTLENQKMLLGEIIPPAQYWQDQDVHMFLHNQVRKSDEYKSAPEVIRQIIDAHCDSHMQIVTPKVGVTVSPEQTFSDGPEQPPQGGGGGGQSQQPQRPPQARQTASHGQFQ